MRILVAGATGYIGSRLVPALLARDHHVVAASSRRPTPSRYPWGAHVEWHRMDAGSPPDVAAAVEGADAVCYLIHALDRPAFAARDRRAAATMAAAVEAAQVPRLVYLSGLVPDVARHRLSAHLASRLEVEELLAQSPAATLSMRAGIVLGAGSTSFEIMRQLAAASLVHPLPPWAHSRVQPIAVVDVLRMLVAALEETEPRGYVDVGGPDVLSYAELLALYCDVARLPRLQVPGPALPTAAVTAAAGIMCAAPLRTVGALVESLRHDMVCGPADGARLVDGPLTTVRESLERSLARPVPARLPGDQGATPSGATDPHLPLAADASWTVALTPPERLSGVRLPLPGPVRAALHVTEHRLRGLWGAARLPPDQ